MVNLYEGRKSKCLFDKDISSILPFVLIKIDVFDFLYDKIYNKSTICSEFDEMLWIFVQIEQMEFVLKLLML